MRQPLVKHSPSCDNAGRSLPTRVGTTSGPRRVFVSLAVCTSIVLTILSAPLVQAGSLVALGSRPVAPDFELEDIGGVTHRLSDMRGTVVLVNFWASWCAPCRAEMPSLERLKKRVDTTSFEVLAINLGESKEDISRFYFSLDPPLTFKILMDRDMHASQFWPMKALPMTFLVDKSGRVTHVSRGARRWDTIEVAKIIEFLDQATEEEGHRDLAVDRRPEGGPDT
ncbi:MAG: TlpA family protein disulfide reductase [Proteobacteria bacterium]|nr:MAG: TlpA family protein disulfide reductase [Pseudomonadota bacterium]